MHPNKKYFKKDKIIPADSFFEKILYDDKDGYYSKKIPFGKDGDFITAPTISPIFGEMIAIWIITVWESFNKPKKFNIIELGPGNGILTKIMLKQFKNFPKFNNAVNIFLYEKSKLMQNIQKKNVKSSKVKWIKNFSCIKKGPAIFFGNEFFDAIPIKQFVIKENLMFEKNYTLNNFYKITEVFKKVSKKKIKEIKKFQTLKDLTFIEFPKLGFQVLKKIIKKISKLSGGLLLIDYGYLKSTNKNTLQSIIRHKKNNILKNLGQADVTSLVNFNLLSEYFIMNNLKVKKIVSQKFFLERMGIVERANNLSKKMSFKEKSDLYFRLKRLVNKNFMGDLFKVIFTYKFKKNNFIGFE